MDAHLKWLFWSLYIILNFTNLLVYKCCQWRKLHAKNCKYFVIVPVLIEKNVHFINTANCVSHSPKIAIMFSIRPVPQPLRWKYRGPIRVFSYFWLLKIGGRDPDGGLSLVSFKSSYPFLLKLSIEVILISPTISHNATNHSEKTWFSLDSWFRRYKMSGSRSCNTPILVSFWN